MWSTPSTGLEFDRYRPRRTRPGAARPALALPQRPRDEGAGRVTTTGRCTCHASSQTTAGGAFQPARFSAPLSWQCRRRSSACLRSHPRNLGSTTRSWPPSRSQRLADRSSGGEWSIAAAMKVSAIRIAFPATVAAGHDRGRSAGRTVPDGTVVRFMTTLGKIVSPVQTVERPGPDLPHRLSYRGHGGGIGDRGRDRQLLEVEFARCQGARPRASAPWSSHGRTRLQRRAAASSSPPGTPGEAHLRPDHHLQRTACSTRWVPDVVRAQGNVVLKSGRKGGARGRAALRPALPAGRLVRLTERGGEHLSVEGERLRDAAGRAQGRGPVEPVKTDETRAWVKASGRSSIPATRSSSTTPPSTWTTRRC